MAKNEEQTTVAKDEDQKKMVSVRILAECSLGKVNDVVEVPADQVKSFGGDVDANPDAVEYARSLKA